MVVVIIFHLFCFPLEIQYNVIIINNSKDRLNYLSHENELPSSHRDFLNHSVYSIYRNSRAFKYIIRRETEMNKC